MKSALRRLLWMALALLAAVLVSGVCWLALNALGDLPGADGVRGVLVVSLSLLALDLLALVGLLAYAELLRTADGAPNRPVVRRDGDSIEE